MEELLNENLLAEEHVLWTGKAETFQTVDKTHKKKFRNKIIICAVVAVALLAGYAALAAREGTGFKPLVALFLLLCCAISPLQFLSDARKLRKALYAVTDQRLLVVIDAVRGVELGQVRSAELRRDEDGHSTLLCGAAALKAKPGKWREITVVGRGTGGEGEVCESFGFYAVADVDGLKAALADRIPLDA